MLLLDKSVPGELHGIGSARMPAPQGTLMATIIKGMLAQKLPWGPVLVGVFAAFMAQLAGAHALSWAVGAYLPISTTAPIWVGGLVRALADSLAQEEGGGRGRAGDALRDGSRRRRVARRDRHRAAHRVRRAAWRTGSTSAADYFEKMGLGGDVIAFGMFALLAGTLLRQALAKDEEPAKPGP